MDEALNRITLLYLGAMGAILAVLGGLGAQAVSSGDTGSANLSSAFVPGQDIEEMREALAEALPEIKESVRRVQPYAVLQFVGMVAFSLGFAALYRLTKRSLAFVAFLGFALLGLTILVSYLVLPSALEAFLEVLEQADPEGGVVSYVPAPMLILVGAQLLSLVLQLGGSLSGGYEFNRVGRELDQGFLRISGFLLMCVAVAAVVEIFIPFYGVYVLYLAIGVTGISFYLLASRVTAASMEVRDPAST
jgi:hypothetical protein